MKIPCAFALLLTTCFATQAATTVIIPDGRSFTDRNGERTNNDADLIVHGTAASSYDNNEYNGLGDCVSGSADCENVKTSTNDDRRETVKRIYDGENSYEENDRRTDAAFVGRSAESFGSGEKASGLSQDENIQNENGPGGPAAYRTSVVMRKIAALNDIVADQYRRGKGGAVILLDLEDPLPVEKSTAKITKHNYVHYHGAELRGLTHGRLEYLSVDPEKDNVYVECSFKSLQAGGAYSTNLSDSAKSGRFTVNADAVHSNVTAGFHHHGRGPAVRTARLENITTDVIATNGRHTDAADAINKPMVAGKYRKVLEETIAKEVYNSTFKGMVARLKAEIKTPPVAVDGNDGHNEYSTGFRDLNWTEGDLIIRVFNISESPRQSSRRPVEVKIGSMSYTRVNEERNAYKLRFDVIVKGLQWTGDLTATLAGQPTRIGSVEFGVEKGVRIRFVVYKSSSTDPGRPECRRVETDVKIDGPRYEFPGQFPASVRSAVEKKLSGFIRRSLVAFTKNAFIREICKSQIVGY